MTFSELGAMVSIGVAVLGAIIAILRIALGQFEKRIGEKFAALEETLRREGSQLVELQRTVETLRQQMPVEYVRREDWIRFSTVIDAKLDRLGERLSDLSRAEMARMRGGQ